MDILLCYRWLFVKGDVFIGEWGMFGAEVFLHYSQFFVKGNFIIGGVECMLRIVHDVKWPKVPMQVLKTQPVSIVANDPLDFCVHLTTMDPSRDSKENALVLTDAFSKFSQSFVTPNKNALTVAKIIVDKWFYIYGIPARIHSDKGWSFANAILEHLYTFIWS